MRPRVNTTDSNGTIATDGGLDLAVRTAIADAHSSYQQKLERWENEGGSFCAISEPISTMRDAQECNDEFDKRARRSD